MIITSDTIKLYTFKINKYDILIYSFVYAIKFTVLYNKTR